MTDPRCEAVRVSLDLGETEGISAHLESCESCRAEADNVGRLTTGLAIGAHIEPPVSLDARVRSLLSPEPFGVLLRPWLAGGLTVAAFVALVSTLAVALAGTPVGEYGPLLALGLGTAYLALSAAAALPLMLHALHANHGRRRPAEVRA